MLLIQFHLLQILYPLFFENQGKYLILNSYTHHQLVLYQDNRKRLFNLRQKKQDITGTAVGFRSIDKVTNGFQPGDLIILAARPGTGKTAIVLNFINNAAKKIKQNINNLF